MQVKLLSNVMHNGQILEEGQTVDLPQEVAEGLLANGVVEASQGGSESDLPLVPSQPVLESSPESPELPEQPVAEVTIPVQAETPVEVPAQAPQEPPVIPQVPVQNPTPEQITETLQSVESEHGSGLQLQ